MPDPTPDERAEALRLLNDAGFAAEAVRNAGLVACAQWIDDAAAALDAAESERAELAREVEEWKQRADNARWMMTEDQASLAERLEQSERETDIQIASMKRWSERAKSAEREVEELRGALWEADSALELMTNYLDDLLDRAKAVNEMKERHPNANAGAYALYAQGRLTELVAKLAALSEPTEGGARP